MLAHRRAGLQRCYAVFRARPLRAFHHIRTPVMICDIMTSEASSQIASVGFPITSPVRLLVVLALAVAFTRWTRSRQS